jgi:hypothetical protein
MIRTCPLTFEADSGSFHDLIVEYEPYFKNLSINNHTQFTDLQIHLHSVKENGVAVLFDEDDLNLIREACKQHYLDDDGWEYAED